MTAVPEERTRRRRADAGVVRATERDVLGMSWVVEMGGMPFDLLQRVLGAPSYSALQNVVSRWRRAGWVETARLGPGPQWCWATRAGIERFGRHPYAPTPMSVTRIAHTREVIQVRRVLERRFRDQDFVWHSERELRWQLGTEIGSNAARQHLPDGVFEIVTPDGEPHREAVEVELTPKSVQRVQANMTASAAGVDAAVWVVSDRALPVVRRACDPGSFRVHERVLIVPLSRIYEELGEEER